MKQRLREFVSRLVEELLDEATYRKDYVEELFHAMKGAMGEYYKARFAEVNGDPNPRTREHWDRETDRLFRSRFHQRVVIKTKGSFDVRKAFDETMEDLRDVIPSELEESGREFAEDFGLDFEQLEYPSDNVTDEFLARCENEFETRRRC